MRKNLIFFIIIVFSFVGCSLINKGEQGERAIIYTNYGKIEIQLFKDKTPITVNNFAELSKGTKPWIHPISGKVQHKPFYDGLTFHRVIPNFMIQGGCPVGNGTGNPGYTFQDEIYYLGKPLKGKIESDLVARQVNEEIILPYLKKNEEPDQRIVEIVEECAKTKSSLPLRKYPIEFYQKITNHSQIYERLGLINKVEYASVCMANSNVNSNGSQFFIVSSVSGCPWLDGKHTVFGKVIKGMDIVHEIENLPKDAYNKPLNEYKPVIEKVVIK